MQDNTEHDDIRKLYESGKISGNISSFDDFMLEYFAPDAPDAEEGGGSEEEDGDRFTGSQKYYGKKKPSGKHGEEEESEEDDKKEEDGVMEDTDGQKVIKFNNQADFEKVYKGIDGKIDFASGSKKFVMTGTEESVNKIEEIAKNLNVKYFTTSGALKEADLQTGFGAQSFFFSKNGDAANYFFKVGEGDEHKCYVLTIGKFSKFGHPVNDKAKYGVFSIVELPEDALDQAVLDKGQFETNDNKIELSDKQLVPILEQLALCVADYLQKDPKCETFFDEMQATVRSGDYDNLFAVSVEKWPGGRDTWKFQEAEKGKLNTIGK